ncbi:MAG: glycosyltransferase [Mojavia pulchra JT2-VF2]|uniref:Glycosyltransferase n=1 Tax=Mojavia pulchra JT2-VF2 TaxID=287848 RepID=A0A951UFA2_9NOST|nr:glycosyltransferase [Mojavia pulchra JT2-VF2]
MNVVNRIQFPSTSETASLYMKCHEGTSLNFSSEHPEVVLIKNGVLSLNTYFNSFFETFYAKYTEITSLYYLLKLEGNFQVSLYREHHDKDERELIYAENFDQCQLCQPVKFSLPDSWRSEYAGRVYLEITCLSENGLFTEGVMITDQPKIREVSLGIVICTFKKETYVKNTVNTILKDNLLQDKKFKVFVVDNGSTLKEDEFAQQRVQLIPNRNVGGSGGFTRGLIQAIEEEVYTHFLLMDDDVELDSESIYRLFPLYEYANQDFAVSGAMLDLYEKYIIHEAGALYGIHFGANGKPVYSPFGRVPLKHKLNLENTTNNIFISEESPDYGAFWFFAFSKEIVEKAGLPMPYFIKVDDMEFGLRIKERLGNPIVAFPGIAVWHEPFYAKNPVWVAYYATRNNLITHSIRSSIGYLDAVNFLTRGLLYQLFIFDYNSAEMLVRGFEDYLKGSSTVKTGDPEKLHAGIVELSKSYKSQSIQPIESPNNKIYTKSSVQKTKLTFSKKLIALFTLNGHLIPNFLLSNEDAFLWMSSDHEDWWPKAFAKKRVVILREGNNSIQKNEMSRSTCIKILIRWVQVVIKGGIRWSSVSSEWRNAFKDLTSYKFWKEYLKLKEQM